MPTGLGPTSPRATGHTLPFPLVPLRSPPRFPMHTHRPRASPQHQQWVVRLRHTRGAHPQRTPSASAAPRRISLVADTFFVNALAAAAPDMVACGVGGRRVESRGSKPGVFWPDTPVRCTSARPPSTRQHHAQLRHKMQNQSLTVAQISATEAPQRWILAGGGPRHAPHRPPTRSSSDDAAVRAKHRP